MIPRLPDLEFLERVFYGFEKESLSAMSTGLAPGQSVA